MKRELKFRAWDKVEKNMLDFDKLAVEAGWGGLSLEDYLNWEDWDLMQLTGLKDSKGVEIYEGDIVKTKINTRYGYVEQTGTVRSEYLGHCIISWSFDGIALDDSTQILEIIGNIYESPELLK